MADSAIYRGLHRAIRALRGKGIEMRRAAGKNSTPGGTKVHRVQGTMNAHDNALVTPGQTDERSTYEEKAEVENGRNVNTGDRNGGMPANKDQKNAIPAR